MAITAVFQNLSMFLGEDKSFQDAVLQADGITPQNVTGWTGTFTVHAYGDPTTVFFTKNWVVLNPTGGVVQVTVANADTIGMLPDQYDSTWERTDSGADAVPTKGLFTILRK